MGYSTTRPAMLRICQIDRWLRSKDGKSLKQIAEELEVSERTVMRDMDYMKYLDAPIEYDRAKNRYRYSDTSYTLKPISLEEGELIAIFLAEKVLRQYSGTPYEQDLRSAFKKIRDSLPEEITIDLSDFESAFSFEFGPIRDTELEKFQTISKAVRDHTTLKMRYYTMSRDDERERTVDPYRMLNKQGDWYLIGYCHWRKDLRDFLISGDRMKDVELTGKGFELNSKLDIEAYLRQSFGLEKGGELLDVSVHFDAYQARWIRERVWHLTQRRDEHKDGSLTLHFKAHGLNEIARWVMQYGSHATVINPKVLRELVMEEAKKMLEQNYKDKQ